MGDLTPKRETRFCTCGFHVYGTDLERRNAIAEHRASGGHEHREKNNAILNADPIGWSALDDSIREAET